MRTEYVSVKVVKSWSCFVEGLCMSVSRHSMIRGLPPWLSGKESAAMQEAWVWSLGGDPLEKGIGNPLQYSCLENPMDRGTWQATVHGDAKSWTRPQQLSTHIELCIRELIISRGTPGSRERVRWSQEISWRECGSRLGLWLWGWKGGDIAWHVRRWHLQDLAPIESQGRRRKELRIWTCNQGDARKPTIEKGGGVYRNTTVLISAPFMLAVTIFEDAFH